MAEKAKPVKGPGPGRMHGPRPNVKNPWKIIRRLMGYVIKKYGLAVAVVILCIFYTAFANVQGTLFMEDLIDDYIQPLLASETPDFMDWA